jgi:hypothetical protein
MTTLVFFPPPLDILSLLRITPVASYLFVMVVVVVAILSA